MCVDMCVPSLWYSSSHLEKFCCESFSHVAALQGNSVEATQIQLSPQRDWASLTLVPVLTEFINSIMKMILLLISL